MRCSFFNIVWSRDGVGWVVKMYVFVYKRSWVRILTKYIYFPELKKGTFVILGAHQNVTAKFLHGV